MINWLRSFNFLTRIYFEIFNYIFVTVKFLINTLVLVVIYFFKNFFLIGIMTINSNFFSKYVYLFCKNITVGFINYTFKILPWWVYNIFIKTYVVGTLRFYFFQLFTFCRSYTIFSNTCDLVLIFFKNFFSKISILFCFFFSCVYNTTIKFLFQNIVKKNTFLKKQLLIIFNLFLVFFTFYIIVLTNVIVILHNFFLGGLFDVFSVWNFPKSKYNYIGVIILMLNVDNFIFLLYLIFVKIGFLNCYYGLENLKGMFYIQYHWIAYYSEFKINNQNFSFTKHIANEFLSSYYNKPSFLKTFVDFIFYNFSLNGFPVFMFFGLLFFLTVIWSWNGVQYIGLNGIFYLNLITLFFFWFSLLLYINLIFVEQKVYFINIGSWVFLSLNVRVDYYFLIDTISFSFILLTTSIALFVFIYAFSYFKYEPLVDRFLLFILSFVISMIFLVSSGNIIMLFLGWELIGFTSFCLINFWVTKTATLKSAFKAFTFNKVSDFFLFLFLVCAFSTYYTFDILQINKTTHLYNQYNIFILNTQVSVVEFLAILLVGAAFIKSAQLGGHAWLPDSMEAPVPASALIHSATLVSAGVYLILRFNPLFDTTEFVKILIPIVGSLTAAYGGVCAVAQSDIKKTLAYSTISHCGFLMVLCATEMNEFTILYLYVHGFFKAGVFMCVGNVLRISRGYQDTRRMGALLKYLPFEYFCIVIGLLNLAGIPFTFGFMIKHLLLISLNNNIYIYYFVLFNSFVGAFAGLFYSYKIVTYTFCDFKKGDIVVYNNLNRGNYNSFLYSNTTLAANVGIIILFLLAYAITIYLFNCFLSGNYQFSDYVNTTISLSYFTLEYSFGGFLLNFSYINLTAIILINYLFWSKFRKLTRCYGIFKYFTGILVLFIFIFIFYNIL